MLIAALGQYFFGVLIFITSIFLVLLVLVQRGRGGGLAGALGGPGGQSAFGTKAGDLFTRITVGVAAVWIFLCASAVFFLKERRFDTGVNRTRAESSIGSDADTTSPTLESSADTTSGTTSGDAEVTSFDEPSADEATAPAADGSSEGEDDTAAEDSTSAEGE